MSELATHVIHDSKNHRLECTHCGGSEPDKLPMLGDLYVAMAKAFIALHRDCK